MTYDTIKRQGSRVYVEVFEIDLDINDPAFPELANDPTSYGTPKTTNDSRAYNPSAIRTYRYSNVNLGSGVHHYPNLNPSGSSYSPATIRPGVDVALSATANVSINDFQDNDSYQLQPPYDNKRVGGSHFRLLKARNFIINRPARILRGYMENGIYNPSNFQVEHYVVKNVTNPDRNGVVKFDLIDRLFFSSEGKGKIPITSGVILFQEINETATSFSFQGTNFGHKSISDGSINVGDTLTVSIAEEIIRGQVTAYNPAINIGTFTVSERGAGGSTPSEHTFRDTVQGCYDVSLRNVTDILRDVFRNFTNIGSSFIDDVRWDEQKANEFASFDLTTIIAKPRDVKALLKELVESTGMWLFYDQVLNSIEIGIVARFDQPIITLTDEEHILQNTHRVTPAPESQVTRATIRFNKSDYTQGKDIQYYNTAFRIQDDIVEADGQFGQIKEAREIISDFYTGTVEDVVVAQSVPQLKVDRFNSLPNLHTFQLDSRYIGNLENGERFWYGSVIRIQTSNVLNPDGTNAEVFAQVTSVKKQIRADQLDRWEVKALSYTASIPPTVDLYIDVDGRDVNITDELVNDFGILEPRQYVVLIRSGVVIGSTSTVTPALETGTLVSGASLLLVNQGFVVGRGGNGGTGGETLGGGEPPVPPTPGNPGGLAINISVDTDIDNLQGLIGGGGAGGSGGDADDEINTGLGGGGGGGAGDIAGVGGPGGSGGGGETVGKPGSLSFGGEGGIAVGDALPGQNGGDLGQDRSGVSGGNAIVTNGNTVNILNGNNPNQIRGDVV